MSADSVIRDQEDRRRLDAMNRQMSAQMSAQLSREFFGSHEDQARRVDDLVDALCPTRSVGPITRCPFWQSK